MKEKTIFGLVYNTLLLLLLLIVACIYMYILFLNGKKKDQQRRATLLNTPLKTTLYFSFVEERECSLEV